MQNSHQSDSGNDFVVCAEPAALSGHTPGPWSCIESKTLIHVETHIDNPAGAGVHICSVPKSREGDARRIVQCVNAHDELLATLELIAEGLSADGRTMDGMTKAAAAAKARAAIAKATGSAS